VFNNARYDEIAYNDFNSDIPPVSFVKQNNTYNYSANSRTGQFSLALEGSAPLTKTLNKNGSAKNYIFSLWINSANAGNISFNLNGNSYSLPYTGSSSWKYYEIKVSVIGLSSTLNAQFQSDQSILIDDVLFYPDVAEASTNAYDRTTLSKTAITNTNGVSNYFSYDAFNRPRLVYDQDKNIISKKAYYNTQTLNTSFDVNIVTPKVPTAQGDGALVNTPVTLSFAGNPDCLVDQITAASWNFGDGSSPVAGLAPVHNYTATGTYTITLTLSSPLFTGGTKTLTANIIIGNPVAVNIPIYYTNNVSSTLKGKISQIVFSQNGTVVATFSESDLISGRSILQGTYTVTVHIAAQGTPLWKSLAFSNDVASGCWPQTSGNTATLNLDLTTSTHVNFTLNTTSCPLN
jgi:hypothetical protein